MKKGYTFLLILCFSTAIAWAQNPVAAFKINSSAINVKPVNPLIYGNFIELGLARQIEGLWSEKLYNASFEEVPPLKDYLWDWLGKPPGTDLTHERWWHSGYETNDWYVAPKSENVIYGTNRYWNFHHGLQAAVLENGQKSGSAFMAQDGIWINGGIRYLFRGYFSNNQTADPTPNPVRVTIGLYPEKQLDKPLAQQTITVPDGVYREFSVELNPGKFDGRSTFAVSVDAGKKIALDGFSLMPMNSVKGWRKEVIDALTAIHVPIIRFPGGCFASFYDWRKGVGPRLDRQPVISEYWGGIEENHAGTVEFIEMCRAIGSEPFLCVNMLTGPADHMAGWVEYCNGSVTTPMGALRKQHGYPEPFKVKYWELDNEAYRRFGWEEYARRCVDYSKAMKAVDPDIKLVMIGYWRFNNNLNDMLAIAGKYIDVITDRAVGETDIKRDLDMIREYNNQNNTHITLSNTEWLAPLDWSKTSLDALNMQKSPNQMTLQEHEISWNYAMNTARQLLLFQRLGGDFEFATFNNLGNTWGQNIIECPKDTVFISAAGRIFELMSRSPLRWVMKTDTVQKLPGVLVQAGTSPRPPLIKGGVPQQDASTSGVIPTKVGIPSLAPNSATSPRPPLIKGGVPQQDASLLIIYILNYRADSPEVSFDLKDFRISSQVATIRTVSAPGPLSSNSYSKPDEIKSSESTLRLKNPINPKFKILPWSVTEITLNILP